MGSSRKDDEDADSEPLLGEADASGYRRPLPGFSTNVRRRSSNDRSAESFSRPAALRENMDTALPDGEQRRLPDLGIALKSILAFWLLYVGLITIR